MTRASLDGAAAWFAKKIPDHNEVTFTISPFSVPFGIDKTSGKVGLVKDVGDNALDFYKLKVSFELFGDWFYSLQHAPTLFNHVGYR